MVHPAVSHDNKDRLYVKVRFTQKMLVKWSKYHSTEPFFVAEEGGKFKMMSGTYKMLIFKSFCISKINL